MTDSQSGSQRLRDLLASQHPCVTIQTFEEDDALALAREVALEMGTDCLAWSHSRGVHDALLADAPGIPETEHPAAALYHLAQKDLLKTLIVLLDVAGHLDDARTLRQLRDLTRKCESKGVTMILIDHRDLPPVIKSVATPFELSMPDEPELEQILRRTVRERNQIAPVKIELDKESVKAILRNLCGLSRRQARQVVMDAICTDQRFDAQDVNHMLALKRKYLQADGLLEYVEAPVDLSEIGGLDSLKRWLKQRQGAMSEEAAKFGLPTPRGVLMLGVQGAGKSLSAKAVATAWQRPLLRLDPGVLYDRYIGESERRLRDALQQAEAMSPIVLWIDEIEKGFASAASHSADGGLSKRMFGSLLTWMQEHTAPVFIIATANDIEALPPELLRKGRFDEVFFIDLPKLEARAGIFAIHLKKRKRDPKNFDLAALANASEGYSGAEIEQAVIAALHESFAKKTDLTTAMVLDALKNSPPLSVTMAEKVAYLRDWASGRCVPAD